MYLIVFKYNSIWYSQPNIYMILKTNKKNIWKKTIIGIWYELKNYMSQNHMNLNFMSQNYIKFHWAAFTV